jgi:levansucrase
MLKTASGAQTEANADCSFWTQQHISGLSQNAHSEAALIMTADADPVMPAYALWDIWPVQLDDGSVAQVAGGDLWIILSAPRRDDPDLRHDEARMRLLHRVGGNWQDCGDVFPDGFAPGSREWSGSTRVDLNTNMVTLWFTAAGRRDDGTHSFEQRLFHATGHLDLTHGQPKITGWQDLTQSVWNDGSFYCDLSVDQGVPGRIKGFRDPYWFRDPKDGQGYILFTGSKSVAASQSEYDGVIGIAIAQAVSGVGAYTLLPPIIDADGLANELERPHVIVRDGQYYLFWSSQKHIFAPDGPAGPTGLYGMVAPSLFGPYRPLNGTGLVVANPASEPHQCYAWQVLPSDNDVLEIVSFVNYWGLNGRDLESDPMLKATHFGGTIAPMVKIAIAADTTRIVSYAT